MKRPVLLGLSLLFLAAAGLGCGAKNEGCVAFARALCDKQIQCSAYVAKSFSAGVESCYEALTNDCVVSATANGSTFNDQKAGACAQRWSAASCDDALTANVGADCHPPGNLANGSACGSDFQCQSLACDITNAGCGKCVPRPKIDEACTDYCDFGLQCVQGKCTTYRKQGEACDLTASCLPTLACLQGSCAPPMVGASCGAPYECTFAGAQYCDMDTLTCKPFNFTVVKNGEACGLGTDTTYRCPPDGYCKTPSAGALFGICTKRPKAGEPCVQVSDGAGGTVGLCDSAGTCVNGTCQLYSTAMCM
ncbi:MAG: hypothetical protein U1A78_28125 [Polyangia bacterium]